QTTTASQRWPPVQYIFSPLSTHSSPSSSAVVEMAAESEPAPGSVIAMAQYSLPNCSFCSAVPTAMIAALPRPPLGTDSIRPISPQDISSTPSTPCMLAPLRTPSLAPPLPPCPC